MALAILDGTQTATTLSTILSSGQHITAHTVVSLGTQAITDILNATSAGLTNTQLRASAVTIGGTVTVGNSLTISSLPAISGTVTANVFGRDANSTATPQIPVIAYDEGIESAGLSYVVPVQLSNVGGQISEANPLPIYGTVTANLGSALPAGTNRIGVVTIGAGTVTIGAGTAQIGSVTASISGTVPISISSVTVGNSVTIGSLPDFIGGGYNNLFNLGDDGQLFVQANVTNLPSIPAGTNQIGTVTANSSNGSLTTRFGSVVTANTAFQTSAVTNANRKYLLIQNITTASNVITVGIGFTPTTTQGIQLFSGAGLTFEGSYIPTGAVNLLSSVTASCYTILEA